MSSRRPCSNGTPWRLGLALWIIGLPGCELWVDPDGLCVDYPARTHYFLDADGDGFGDPDSDMGCEKVDASYVTADLATDCDDLDAQTWPGAVEQCDEVDNDCDGLIDDDDETVVGTSTWYPDADEDGFGSSDADSAVASCLAPDDGGSWLTEGDDCDDSDPDENPDAVWYPDEDEDGYGDPDSAFANCEQLPGWVIDGSDCHDGNALLNPETVWYYDADLDGYGLSDDFIESCEPEEPYTGTTTGDTDDDNPYFTTAWPWVEVEVGFAHSCGRRSAGSVQCWGADSYGQVSVPDDLPASSAVAVGVVHSCALDEAGGVTCWGEDEGRLDVPADSGFVDLDAGLGNSCVVDDLGQVRCWGFSSDSGTVLDLPAAEQVALGDFDEACVLGEDGGLACLSSSPPDGKGWVDIVGNVGGWCALSDAGDMSCWSSVFEPVAPEGGPYTAMAIGATGWTCGGTDEGTVDCVGTEAPELQGNAEGVGVAGMDAGSTHACLLLASGEVECAGSDSYGESSVPLPGPYELAAGADVTCGRGHDDAICWGDAATLQQAHDQWVDLATGFDFLCMLSQAGTIGCGAMTFSATSAPIQTDVAEASFTQLSVAGDTPCGLRTDGSGVCWDESTGEGPEDLVWVGAGHGFACGVVRDGSLDCWGDAPDGMPVSANWVSVDGGYDQACAVDLLGTITCWGTDAHGEASAPDDDDFVAVSTDWVHSCGLHDDGRISCWGEDIEGSTEPPDEVFTSVSVADGLSCGALEAGGVRCWGEEDSSAHETPVDEDFVAVSPGPFALYACGLHDDGRVSCWGDQAPDWVPTANLGTSTSPGRLAVGDGFSCALNGSGEVVCSGRDDVGQASAPAAGGTPFTQVVSGKLHACGLDEAGGVTCWGHDAEGQASPPSDLGVVEKLAAGGGTTCALLESTELACWGAGTDDALAVPEGLRYVVDVAVGDGFICVADATGALSCWGDDSQGQTQGFESLGEPYVSVAAGDAHACALDALGRVVCWGADDDGQVTDRPRYLFRQLALGERHSCGLQLDRTVVCWGADDEGQGSPPEWGG